MRSAFRSFIHTCFTGMLFASIALTVLLSSSPARAAAIEPSSQVAAKLAEINALIEKRAYSSAFQLARKSYAEEHDPWYIDSMVSLCTGYFVRSIMHTSFAFRDLQPGEDIMQLRASGSGSFDIILFDPQKIVADHIRDYGDHPVLHRALGVYFRDIIFRYGDKWQMTRFDLAQRSREEFLLAVKGGMGNADICLNLAEMFLSTANVQEANSWFEKAISMGASGPDVEFNYATSLYHAEKYEQALVYANKALAGYEPGDYHADSLLLVAGILEKLEKSDEQIKVLLQGTGQYNGDTRFVAAAMPVLLKASRQQEAADIADGLFAHNPEDINTLRFVIMLYLKNNATSELDSFFTRNLERHKSKTMTCAILYLHQAQYFEHIEKKEQALEAIHKARDSFSRVFPADHQVFEVLNKMEEDLGKKE